MCGIFGVVGNERTRISPAELKVLVDRLYILSMSRGSDATGVAAMVDGAILVHKEARPASQMIRGEEYANLFDHLFGGSPAAGERPVVQPFTIIGHARMATNGSQSRHDNNQPVVKHNMAAVHNGIITNTPDIQQRFEFDRRFDVDTEFFLDLVHHFLSQTESVSEALVESYKQLAGTASVGLISADLDQVIFATNHGSLYHCTTPDHGIHIFASERSILQRLVRTRGVRHFLKSAVISHVAPNHAQVVNTQDLQAREVCFCEAADARSVPRKRTSVKRTLTDWTFQNRVRIDQLRRCTRCILPETMPYVDFDEHGVCSYCRRHTPRVYHGHEALKDEVRGFRRNDGRPDIIVPLSGGRDSCYGLHYIKHVLKMNPIAFTYDWGMITDLARRNIARMCGQLEVEHILVSADIRRKRHNVRRNIDAWLRQPDLGMVPLFMAGDKQFYYHANRLMKELDINLIVFSENRKFEQVEFKSGFCGVNQEGRRVYQVSLRDKMQMAAYYLRRFLTNPSYLNSSLWDTFTGYFSAYHIKHDYLYLYDYVLWDERQIADTLVNEYSWELATDTRSTWRIGDGTAPFYNYIYYTMAGFTENDAFRSHQVREGLLTRDEALRLVAVENQPRWESLHWYAETLGFNLDEAISIIDAAGMSRGLSRASGLRRAA